MGFRVLPNAPRFDNNFGRPPGALAGSEAPQAASGGGGGIQQYKRNTVNEISNNANNGSRNHDDDDRFCFRCPPMLQLRLLKTLDPQRHTLNLKRDAGSLKPHP